MHDIVAEMESLIRHAIQNHLTLEFDYHDAPRIADPHYFGRTTKGNDAISCWQYDGKSNNGEIPDPRIFLLSDIRNLKITEEHFVPQISFKSPPPNFREIYCSVFEENANGKN